MYYFLYLTKLNIVLRELNVNSIRLRILLKYLTILVQTLCFSSILISTINYRKQIFNINIVHTPLVYKYYIMK